MANSSRKRSMELSDVASTSATSPFIFVATPATASISSKKSKTSAGPKKDEV